MGINKESKEFLEGLYKMGEFSTFNSVIELGSQDDNELISKVKKASDYNFKTLPKRYFAGGDFSPLVEDIDNLRISSNHFYSTLGFSSYDCIDLDGAYNAFCLI